MESGLRLAEAVQADVLRVVERIETTVESHHIRVIKPEIPEGLDDPFLLDLMTRGFKLDRLGDYVRISIFGAVRAVAVAANGELEITEQEFPVCISELVSLRLSG